MTEPIFRIDPLEASLFGRASVTILVLGKKDFDLGITLEGGVTDESYIVVAGTMYGNSCKLFRFVLLLFSSISWFMGVVRLEDEYNLLITISPT